MFPQSRNLVVFVSLHTLNTVEKHNEDKIHLIEIYY
jgi:hypothetical protein